MSQRMVMQAGSANPFRLSFAGINAAGAAYQQLAFDGNFRSIRRYSFSYFATNHSYTANVAGSITFAGANQFPFGKTFPTPPVVLMCIVSQYGSDPSYVTPWDFQAGDNSASYVRSYGGGWATTTDFWSPKQMYFAILDLPVA